MALLGTISEEFAVGRMDLLTIAYHPLASGVRSPLLKTLGAPLVFLTHSALMAQRSLAFVCGFLGWILSYCICIKLFHQVDVDFSDWLSQELPLPLFDLLPNTWELILFKVKGNLS